MLVKTKCVIMNYNLACRMYNFIFVSHNVSLYEMFLIPYKQIRIIHTIFKAISKIGSLGSCVASIDVGSNERMTIQNL